MTGYFMTHKHRVPKEASRTMRTYKENEQRGEKERENKSNNQKKANSVHLGLLTYVMVCIVMRFKKIPNDTNN
jgi:predicted Holliday junction resolvase-like endonuclease